MTSKYPKKIATYITKEDYSMLEKLSKEKFHTSVSAVVRSAISQLVKNELKEE